MTTLNASNAFGTLDPRIESQATTVDGNFDLPTNVKAGQRVVVVNRTGNNTTLTIRASDASTIEAIALGSVMLVALQDNPTTSIHWLAMNLYEKYVYTTTFTFNGAGGTSAATTVTLQRNDKTVSIVQTAALATTGTGSTTFTSNTNMPARFMPGGNIRLQAVTYRQNNVASTTPGHIRIGSSGDLVLTRDAANTAWSGPATANTGFDSEWSLTYGIK